MKQKLFKMIVFSWKLLPFKKIGASIVKKIPFLKSKLYKDLRYIGKMEVKLKNTSFKTYNPGYTTIENEIFWNGLEGWEKISLGLWQKYTQDSKVILDIGANSGIYSLIAAANNPSAKIYSFEPVKRTSDLLKKNLLINPNFNITLIEKAVSNIDGKATFYDVDSQSQYSASLNKKMLENVTNQITYDVETIKLDDFEILKNQKIDLIKLDVEMHEPEAIEGMLEIIRRDKPTILIEILTDEIAQKIENLLNGLNYYYYSIDEKSPPQLVQNLRKSTFYNYLLVQKKLD